MTRHSPYNRWTAKRTEGKLPALQGTLCGRGLGSHAKPTNRLTRKHQRSKTRVNKNMQKTKFTGKESKRPRRRPSLRNAQGACRREQQKTAEPKMTGQEDARLVGEKKGPAKTPLSSAWGTCRDYGKREEKNSPNKIRRTSVKRNRRPTRKNAWGQKGNVPSNGRVAWRGACCILRCHFGERTSKKKNTTVRGLKERRASKGKNLKRRDYHVE